MSMIIMVYIPPFKKIFMYLFVCAHAHVCMCTYMCRYKHLCTPMEARGVVGCPPLSCAHLFFHSLNLGLKLFSAKMQAPNPTLLSPSLLKLRSQTCMGYVGCDTSAGVRIWSS